MPVTYLRRRGRKLYGINRKRRVRRRTTRTYRRKGRGTRLSRKRIMEMTSRKKRDNMRMVNVPVYGGVGQSGSGINLSSAPTTDPTSNRVNFLLWGSTQRRPTIPNPSVFARAERTSTECYMKGLSERVRVVTSGADEWEWRRITFCFRGPGISSIQTPNFINTDGVYRLLYNASQDSTGTNASLLQSTVYGILFAGVFQRDWDDPMIAGIDKLRVDLKSDRTRFIRSGNQNPVSKIYKNWYPMNKNIFYDDDENGPSENSSSYSVADKRGMGDYYVLDIVRCTNPSSGGAQLFFETDTTLYWHEK